MRSVVQPAPDLCAFYTQALRAWILERKPAGPDLARRARSLEELVTVHHEAMAELLGGASPDQHASLLVEAGRFLAACMPERADTSVRSLSQHLEEQARRIAHALHDEAGQIVACIQMAFDQIAAEMPCGGCERFRSAARHLDHLEIELRRLSHELRPTVLEDFGLLAAIESLAEGLRARRGIELRVQGSTEGRLASHLELQLYRIVQEAVTNAAKYSGADTVEVRVERESDAVCLIVRDPGAGFDLQAVRSGQRPRGLGLLGIEERVATCRGTLHIDSAPGRGTEIVVRVPLVAPG